MRDGLALPNRSPDRANRCPGQFLPREFARVRIVDSHKRGHSAELTLCIHCVPDLTGQRHLGSGSAATNKGGYRKRPLLREKPSSQKAPFAGGCRSRIPPDGGAMLMLLRPPC